MTQPVTDTKAEGILPGRAGSESDQSVLSDQALSRYVERKLELGAQLRMLRELLKVRRSEARVAACDALLSKLAEDRFTLAVLGQFSRGKSSLMNAVIGREILPVGLVPLTSAVTVLRFGPRERLLVRMQGWAFLHEAPLVELADYVTEKGNPGNRKQVQAVYVEVPVPFLRRGLEFVDTPGISSAIRANTATTYGFLPSCDAAIFVTGADSPLTEAEIRFLRDVRAHVGKLFLVLNKIDLARESEGTDAISFVTAALRRETGVADSRVFPVSARMALDAKQAKDGALLARSGFPEFEAALAEFLARERSDLLLKSTLEKAERLASGELAEAAIRQEAGALPPELRERRRGELEAGLRAHAAERAAILRELSESFESLAIDRFEQPLAALLAQEARTGATRLARLMPHLRRIWPGRAASRFMRGWRGSFGRKAAAWYADGLMRAMEGTPPGSLPGFEALERNLAGIVGIAAAMARAQTPPGGDGQVVPPWQPPGAFPTPPVPELAKRPPVPPLLRFLPVALAGEAFKDQIRSWIAAFVAEFRMFALRSARQAAREAFAAWAAAVETFAARHEARAMELLAGVPPPDFDGTVTALERVRTRLRRLEAHMKGSDEAVGEAEVESGGKIRTRVALAPVEPYRDLSTPGCPVCDRLADVASRYTSWLQYALTTDERAQDAFAADLGLCPLHLWQLEAVSSPVGISAGQAKLAKRIEGMLQRAAEGAEGGSKSMPAPPAASRCPMCRLIEEQETEYLSKMLVILRDPAGKEAYGHSQGLCLRHLASVAARLDGPLRSFVLRHAADRFREWSGDMRSFALKTEALRRDLRHSDEEAAYWRALTHIAGSRAVCLPWANDREI